MQVYYKPNLKSKLKIPFQGIDSVQENFSNLCQDMFVLSVLNGKTNGTYLEIGGELPIIGNNTYLLESVFGWKGVSVELDSKFIPMWAQSRRNPIVNANALTTDYAALLAEHNLGPVIDYLSCDIEPQDATLAALQKVDHDKFRFRVITFEHDHYNGGTGPWTRDENRKFLSSLGYELLVGDAAHQGELIEDWWVAPELVDKEIADKLKMASTWNADEAIYNDPVSGHLKVRKFQQAQPLQPNFQSGQNLLDNGYISLV